MEEIQAFAGRWIPFFLYVSDTALLAPWYHATIVTFDLAEGIVTGLATTPSNILVVYALTNGAESSLAISYRHQAQRTLVAAASGLSKDLWFHEPMTIAPGNRWLIVVGSEGREALFPASAGTAEANTAAFREYAGDLWLIDCSRLCQPRRVMRGVRLLSCCWAPSGRYVVCEVQGGTDGDVHTVILEVENGEVLRILEGHGHAVWQADSRKVKIFRATSDPAEVVTYDVATRESCIQRSTGPWVDFLQGVVWSDDGSAGARHDERGGHAMIQIGDMSGRLRMAPAPTGATRLLGWSHGAELLAYLSRDNAVHFCVGTTSVADYDRLVATMPPPPISATGDATQGFAMQTSDSPVKVSSATQLIAGWTLDSDGPCLLYVDAPDCRGQRIRALAFKRMSLADLGVDLRQDLREQIVRETCTLNLEAVSHALRRYAADHDGYLPPHATGMELAEHLEGYLGDSSRLGSAYAPNEIRARLLRPGENLKQLENMLRGGQLDEIAVAELRGDDGFMFLAKGALRPPDPADPLAGNIWYYVETIEPGTQ
jgi:hypothetical protein